MSQANNFDHSFHDVYQAEDIVQILQHQQSGCVVDGELHDGENNVDKDDSKQCPLECKVVDKVVETHTTPNLWYRGESGLPVHQLYDPHTLGVCECGGGRR